MTFEELNASGYRQNEVFYNAEFEEILSKIILCYNMMISDDIQLINDENFIRDVLYLNYLNDNKIRREIGLKDYYFDREIPEDRTKGRTDIRILSFNTFEDTSAYYIIECKRIDSINNTGTTGLNAKYIKNGICRFTSQSYSAFYKTNAMMGFIVKEIDIHKNVEQINFLLNNSFIESNTTQVLMKRKIVPEFDFSYYSMHKANENEISIYHLMFDFSKNMK